MGCALLRCWVGEVENDGQESALVELYRDFLYGAHYLSMRHCMHAAEEG
jgi:hypothetical protein